LIGTQSKLKVIHNIKIEAPSDLQSLDKVLLKFNSIYQDFIPSRTWLQCRLALAEGFTNAVRHAHRDLPSDTSIIIEVRLDNTGIEIRIWDHGSAFDLKNFILKTAKKNHSWLSSGRGIPILRKISDRLDYYRIEDKQNCLLIVKYFSDIKTQI